MIIQVTSTKYQTWLSLANTSSPYQKIPSPLPIQGYFDISGLITNQNSTINIAISYNPFWPVLHLQLIVKHYQPSLKTNIYIFGNNWLKQIQTSNHTQKCHFPVPPIILNKRKIWPISSFQQFFKPYLDQLNPFSAIFESPHHI